MTKTCLTCEYFEPTTDTCCNPTGDHVGNEMCSDDSCERWSDGTALSSTGRIRAASSTNGPIKASGCLPEPYWPYPKCAMRLIQSITTPKTITSSYLQRSM